MHELEHEKLLKYSSFKMWNVGVYIKFTLSPPLADVITQPVGLVYTGANSLTLFRSSKRFSDDLRFELVISNRRISYELLFYFRPFVHAITRRTDKTTEIRTGNKTSLPPYLSLIHI